MCGEWPLFAPGRAGTGWICRRLSPVVASVLTVGVPGRGGAGGPARMATVQIGNVRGLEIQGRERSDVL